MFGGYIPELGRTNDIYIIDMKTMVSLCGILPRARNCRFRINARTHQTSHHKQIPRDWRQNLASSQKERQT